MAALSRNEAIERALGEKRAQGYRIESQNDTEAVVWMRGPRRFLNLFRGDEVRYLLSFDENGRATSRRVDFAG
jgi:hypothetical protein